MSNNHEERSVPGADPARQVADLPVVVTTILSGDGITGVDTHIRQLRHYLNRSEKPQILVTPFSWARPLTYPVFGLRSVLQRCCPPVGVAWYLHWHEVFVRNALRHVLAKAGDCVIYAQDPFSARAALRVRRGQHQRVVMAVHLRISMADEWADKNQIGRDGLVFNWIRRIERTSIPDVDGLVYVSRWARTALTAWMPEAETVPAAVIGNFVAPLAVKPMQEPLGDLVTVGNLDLVKNHRYLLDVLAAARQLGKALSLDIFGEGPCRKDLQRQARDLGLNDQVRLRGFRSDVREHLPRYRTYVHASYSESSSLVIMEAMAAGLPILAGSIGPIEELCDDGIEARFWPLDDPAKAAAVLVGLLDSEQELLRAAQAALERFRRDYDAAVVGPQLMSFLQGATRQVPRAGAQP
jgi:glycosyltransferase involved in cell wall biosynthesis